MELFVTLAVQLLVTLAAELLVSRGAAPSCLWTCSFRKLIVQLLVSRAGARAALAAHAALDMAYLGQNSHRWGLSVCLSVCLSRYLCARLLV